MKGIKLYIGALDNSEDICSLSYQIQEETGYIYHLEIELNCSKDLFVILRAGKGFAALEIDGYFRAFIIQRMTVNKQKDRVVIGIP